jgi:outer membrane protein assembly factor BamB
LKRLSAFLLIVVLCLSLLSVFMIADPAQSFSTRDPVTVTQLWQFSSLGDYDYPSISSPVVAYGYVYFTSQGSGDLYCLDASNGAQIWSASAAGSFTVANGYIYVSAGGDVLCFNALSGVQLWNFSHAVAFGAPAVVGGIVYVGGLNSTSTPNDIGCIYALNASTGTKIWDYLGPAGTGFNGNSPVLAGENLYAFSVSYSNKNSSYSSVAYTFEASTGEELWNYSAIGDFSSLAADGQNVYVASSYVDTTNFINSENVNGRVFDGGVVALNAPNGETIWNYPIDSSVTSPIIANGTVYVVSGDGSAYAFNAADGALKWHYVAGTGLGQPFLVNSYLYIGSSFGAYCLNPNNGSVIWNFATSDFAGSSPTYPTYSDGVIYVGWNGPMFFSPSTQHNFYAVDASDGKELWNYTIGYTVQSPPAVAVGTVYIGANWVTTQSPDFEGSGAVLALKPEETLPLLMIAAIIVVVILIATAVLLLRKRIKTKEINPPLPPDFFLPKMCAENDRGNK